VVALKEDQAAMDETIKMRKPDFSKALSEPSGRVVRDEMGNAVWLWSPRGRSTEENLAGAALTLLDDVVASPHSQPAPQLGGGQDPYRTVPRGPRKAAVKRDLRALSKVIVETRRARAAAELAAADNAAKKP
jgi:hypothetical protein